MGILAGSIETLMTPYEEKKVFITLKVTSLNYNFSINSKSLLKTQQFHFEK